MQMRKLQISRGAARGAALKFLRPNVFASFPHGRPAMPRRAPHAARAGIERGKKGFMAPFCARMAPEWGSHVSAAIAAAARKVVRRHGGRVRF
jgi:hypothetical protein